MEGVVVMSIYWMIVGMDRMKVKMGIKRFVLSVKILLLFVQRGIDNKSNVTQIVYLVVFQNISNPDYIPCHFWFTNQCIPIFANRLVYT